MKQFTMVIAKSGFQIKSLNGRGRPVNVKPGDLFLVTSPAHNNKDQVMVDRKARAMINSGYCLSRADLETFFGIVE